MNSLYREMVARQELLALTEAGDPKESPEPPEMMAIQATQVCKVTRVTPDPPEIPERLATRGCKGTQVPSAPQDPRAQAANPEFQELLASQVELDKMAALDHEDLMVFLV